MIDDTILEPKEIIFLILSFSLYFEFSNLYESMLIMTYWNKLSYSETPI